MQQTNQMETLSLFDYIYKAWPLFLGCLGLSAWLLRLEAKVTYQEKRIDTLEELMKYRDEAMWKAFSEIQKDMKETLQHLSKIEGKLEGLNNNKNQ